MKTDILPPALYWASFDSFEMRLPGQCVIDCAQSGANDAAVAHWAPIIAAQCDADAFPNRPTSDKVRAELQEYGVWDDADLADDSANWERLVWCAAWNVAEDDAPDCSLPVNANLFHPPHQ